MSFWHRYEPISGTQSFSILSENTRKPDVFWQFPSVKKKTFGWKGLKLINSVHPPSAQWQSQKKNNNLTSSVFV